MTGMIVHPRDLFDQSGNSGQRPQIGWVAVRPCASKQLFLNELRLVLGKPAFSAGLRRTTQSLTVSVEPIAVPSADALPTHSENTSDGGLSFTFLEKLDRFVPSVLQRLKSLLSPIHKKSIQQILIHVTIFCEIQ